MTRMREAIGRVIQHTWSAITSVVGIDELLIYAAIGLVAKGASMVWAPGAYLVPGIVMLWMYLPQRGSFIARPPAPARRDD